MIGREGNGVDSGRVEACNIIELAWGKLSFPKLARVFACEENSK